jgi:hypothetical protein
LNRVNQEEEAFRQAEVRTLTLNMSEQLTLGPSRGAKYYLSSVTILRVNADYFTVAISHPLVSDVTCNFEPEGPPPHTLEFCSQG